MAEIIGLPENIIGKEDHEALESYGGHEISRGRATRFHWDKDEDGSPVFQIFRGGADEELVVTIRRDREKDEFQAITPQGKQIVSGTLEHVMAVLDEKLAREHGEETGGPV